MDRAHQRQAVVVIGRKGNIVSTNIEAVLASRKKHEPEVYKAALDGLMEIIAEATVKQLLAEDQRRIAGGFAYFAQYRLERGLVR